MQTKFKDLENKENAIDEIIAKYKTGKYNYAKLAKEYLTSKTTIIRILKNAKVGVLHDKNMLRRKYTLNQNYFDTIDSEEKAYFLGLLYADGCNSVKKRTISISLQAEDKEILDKLNYAIGCNSPLTFCKRQKKSYKDIFRLNIYSVYLSNKLEKLGIIERKSLLIKFPTEEQIPNVFIKSFIRGFYDGNGSCGLYDGDFNSSICSTKIFCEELFKRIRNILSINLSYSCPNKDNTPEIRVLNMSSTSAFIFLDWLYKDANIYLNRKKIKYDKARADFLLKPRQQIFDSKGNLLLIDKYFGEKE